MITEIIKINKTNNLQKIPKDLPIYLFSGSFDPEGNFTNGVKQVHDAFRKMGINDVTLKFYPGGRHEMLNEINRNVVYRDVIQWMDERNQSSRTGAS
jgi:alpha-beta hydrolase superfamily lysophospholipase